MIENYTQHIITKHYVRILVDSFGVLRANAHIGL